MSFRRGTSGGGGAHPDSCYPYALGLATQTELDAAAAALAHPDLATHTALGIARQDTPGGLWFAGANTASGQWTNQPAPEGFWLGNAGGVWRGSLATMTQFRWSGNVWSAGTAGALVILSYSVNSGANWLNIATEPLTVHSWSTALANLPAGARVDPVWIAIRGSGGNGTDDPAIEHISVMFR